MADKKPVENLLAKEDEEFKSKLRQLQLDEDMTVMQVVRSMCHEKLQDNFQKETVDVSNIQSVN